MYSIPYEITALITRYVLIVLCAFVLFRTIFIARASRNFSEINSEKYLAKLVMLDTNREFKLGLDNIIGRSNRCDVQVYGKEIAKIHLQIYKKKDKWLLYTYSKNNTLLNEIKISGRAEINSHDIIKMGNKDFRFIVQKGATK